VKSQKVVVEKESPPLLPEFVSLRWLAFACGVAYSTIAVMSQRANFEVGFGASRKLSDVRQKLGRRIVDEETLRLLAEHVPVTITQARDYFVPGKVYLAIKIAWKLIGAPGNDTLKNSNPEIEEMSAYAKIEQVRLESQEEGLRQKRLANSRLMGMMADKAAVLASGRQIALKFQRCLHNLPARIVGEMKKQRNFSDEELREIEKSIQAMLLPVVAEIREDIKSGIEDASIIAGARRYADRNWSATAGSA